jgi:Fructosamine kinase
MTTADAIAAQALRMAGDQTPLRSCEPVGGGMISQTARVVSGHGAYLLKWGGQGLANFFTVEARGLELLATAGALRVPAVLAYCDTPTTDHRPRPGKNREPRTKNRFAANRGGIHPPGMDRGAAAC